MNQENTPKTNLVVQLSGEDGNVFNLAGIVSKELRRNGHETLEMEMRSRLFQQESYDAVLRLFSEYVKIE